MVDRQVMINIQAGRVSRVAGTVMNFFIEYGDTRISFGQDIEIGSFLPEAQIGAAVKRHLRRRKGLSAMLERVYNAMPSSILSGLAFMVWLAIAGGTCYWIFAGGFLAEAPAPTRR